MPNYLVTWEINIDAESPYEAARKARAIQAKPDTTATVFRAHADDGTEVVDLIADTWTVAYFEHAYDDAATWHGTLGEWLDDNNAVSEADVARIIDLASGESKIRRLS